MAWWGLVPLQKTAFQYFGGWSSFTGKFWSSGSSHMPLAYTDWRRPFIIKISNCPSWFNLFLVSFSTGLPYSLESLTFGSCDQFFPSLVLICLPSSSLSYDYPCWTVHFSRILVIRQLSSGRPLILYLLGYLLGHVSTSTSYLCCLCDQQSAFPCIISFLILTWSCETPNFSPISHDGTKYHDQLKNSENYKVWEMKHCVVKTESLKVF